MYLSQSLDLAIFNCLKQNYKILLVKKPKFTMYNIDKADFISLIQKILYQGIYSKNTQSV